MYISRVNKRKRNYGYACFQVESNKVLPQQGSILISSPFMNDYHFTRAVVLLIEHNDEGSMGIIMNKDFRYHILLNDLIPNWNSHSGSRV